MSASAEPTPNGTGTGGVTLTSVNGQPITQFSTFANKLEITNTSFELVSNFTLDSSKSERLNPLFEDTKLTVGSYSATIPAELWHQNSKGYYVYEGTINGEHLEVQIVPNTPVSFRLKVEGSGLPMSAQSPTFVELMIGHHMGVQAVTPDD